jgi:hypothetical protein
MKKLPIQASKIKSNPVPRASFAHQMVRLNGWTRDAAINEIAGMDRVDEKEAERRFDAARQQQINRKVGQARRQDKIKMAIEDARMLALAIAYHQGAFICSRDLPRISDKAGWSYSVGFNSTGRAMREIIDPMEKSGFFAELCNEDERFIGYSLTEAGRKKVLGEDY